MPDVRLAYLGLTEDEIIYAGGDSPANIGWKPEWEPLTLFNGQFDAPGEVFHGGDTCWVDLETTNAGPEQEVDLYILLHVLGQYWSYPSWQSLDAGLDHADVLVPANSQDVLHLIPEFSVPPVAIPETIYFYAAMFEDGWLDLDHLASNGAVLGLTFAGP